MMLFVIIPYNTFGEDVKVLKDTGLTSIMLLAIIVAVWSASVSISDEIEGRTALTLLSKPVRRRQFILGKFLGILWPVLLLFVLLGLWLLFAVSVQGGLRRPRSRQAGADLAGLLLGDGAARFPAWCWRSSKR